MVLRPSKAGLAVNALVILVGLGLAALGVQGLLSAGGLLNALLVAAGGYALWQGLHTPLGLRVAGGRVARLGLFPASLALSDLRQVQLVHTGYRRLPTLRFVRRDGSVAFTVDATLWDRAKLEKLLGRKVERAGR